MPPTPSAYHCLFTAVLLTTFVTSGLTGHTFTRGIGMDTTLTVTHFLGHLLITLLEKVSMGARVSHLLNLDRSCITEYGDGANLVSRRIGTSHVIIANGDT